MTPERVATLVTAALTDDLRRPPWRGAACPLKGHCYVASEAAWHLLGGSSGPWRPQFIRHEDQPHWFLRNGPSVLDITAAQFEVPVPYDRGVGKGFLTRMPSKRAREVLRRVDTRASLGVGRL